MPNQPGHSPDRRRGPGARLADGGRLTGIIDWETARVDHPRAYARARGWASAPARWRPLFASGMRLVFSPIPVIRLSSARSKSTSPSYSSPIDFHLRQTTQLPNRLAATTRQPAGASGQLARAGCPVGHAASTTVTSAGGGRR